MQISEIVLYVQFNEGYLDSDVSWFSGQFKQWLIRLNKGC